MKSVLISPARYLGCVPVCVDVCCMVRWCYDHQRQTYTEHDRMQYYFEHLEWRNYRVPLPWSWWTRRVSFPTSRVSKSSDRSVPVSCECVFGIVSCVLLWSLRTEISEPSKIPESTRTTSDSVRHFVGSWYFDRPPIDLFILFVLFWICYCLR